MTLTVILSFVIFFAFIGSSAFAVYRVVTFIPRFEAAISSLSGLEEKEFGNAKRRIAYRYFNKVSLVQFVCMLICTACTKFGKWAKNGSPVWSVLLVVVLVVSGVVLTIHFRKLEKKYGLRKENLDGRRDTLLPYGLGFATFFSLMFATSIMAAVTLFTM